MNISAQKLMSEPYKGYTIRYLKKFFENKPMVEAWVKGKINKFSAIAPTKDRASIMIKRKMDINIGKAPMVGKLY